jgi:hypothetical protein
MYKYLEKRLTYEEKLFLTHIFRFFTQLDIDVALVVYVRNYLPYFPQPENSNDACLFAAREATSYCCIFAFD